MTQEQARWRDSVLLRAQVVQAWITLAEAARRARVHPTAEKERSSDEQHQHAE